MSGTGIPAPFRGPLADGPTPDQLVVDAPSLERLRLAEARRYIVVQAVLVWCVVAALVRSRRSGSSSTLAEAACEGLIDGFIRLGPTLVKAGQIIASSAALFPPVLANAARRCLDAVPPFPVDHVHRVIVEDLGRPLAELFISFDDTPLSAASIGQVHACRLADGRDAVVKVQRPGIPELMATDLRIGFRLAWLVEKTPWGAQTNARDIIRDLHAVTFEELNPVREAWQQHEFRARIGAFGDNEHVTAPEVYWDHCGERVICMERVYGTPMDHFDAIEAQGIDAQTVLRRGAKVWAEAVMVHGPFHGDMHAGNIWVLDDGRACYLDFGIMGELPDEWKQVLKDLFYTCGFDPDFLRVARAYRAVGAIPDGLGTDEELAALMDEIFGTMLTQGFASIDIAALVPQSLQMLKAYDAVIPRELVLIAKQLLYVDKFTKHLAPDYSLTSDPMIVRNIFPVEAAARARQLGLDLADDTMLPPTGAETPSTRPDDRPAPSQDGDTVTHVFLSPEWIAAVEALREEFPMDLVPSDLPSVAANLTVTGAPFGDGTVRAHASNTTGSLVVELGHHDDAPLHLTVDHAVARDLIVGKDANAAIRAFLMGQITLDGDLDAILGDGVDPMSLLASLNLGVDSTLDDIDPTAADLARRILDLTA